MDLVNLGPQVVALGREVREVPIFQENLGLGFKGFTPVARLRAWPHKLVYGCRLTSRGSQSDGGEGNLGWPFRPRSSCGSGCVLCQEPNWAMASSNDMIPPPWLERQIIFDYGANGCALVLHPYLLVSPLRSILIVIWMLWYMLLGACRYWQCGTSHLGNGWWTGTWPGGDDPAQVCFVCGAHVGEILGCCWWSVWCRCFLSLGSWTSGVQLLWTFGDVGGLYRCLCESRWCHVHWCP